MNLINRLFKGKKSKKSRINKIELNDLALSYVPFEKQNNFFNSMMFYHSSLERKIEKDLSIKWLDKLPGIIYLKREEGKYDLVLELSMDKGYPYYQLYYAVASESPIHCRRYFHGAGLTINRAAHRLYDDIIEAEKRNKVSFSRENNCFIKE